STAATSPYRFRTPTTRMSMSAVALPIDCRERLLEQGQALFQLLVRHGQGGKEPDDVPVEATGKEEQAALEGHIDDRLGAIGRPLGELERDHRAEPAHVPDRRMRRRERVEPCTQRLAKPCGALEELRLAHRLEHGDGGRARERVAAERPAEAAG